MSAIPSNLLRVPNLLRSGQLLTSINRSNVELLVLQTQMASGKAISRFSDDPIAASTINVLRERLARGEQTLRNLSTAQSTLDYLDSTVGDATVLVREAAALASGQIGITSDATTRNTQAVVVDGYIRSLYEIANRSTNGLYVFGGSTATTRPIEEIAGGFRYVGRGTGQLAELGSASDVPITIGGDNAIGETSTRIRSTLDLDPALTASTRLSDLTGARGLGVSKGLVAFAFGGGPTVTVDLSQADTIQDVANVLESAIAQYETDQSVSILGPGGVDVAGGSITIDAVSGTPLTFTDVNLGTTGGDLGLTQAAFTSSNTAGADVGPKLTLLTPLSAVPGLTVPPGTIRFRFSSGSGSRLIDVDLSSAATIDDLRNLIEVQVPGVRVQVNSAGTGIDVVNEISGPALSIEPTGLGVDTATELGIRTLDYTTRLTDFNNGRGVGIVDGRADPVSGLVTRQYNTDFRITLGNGQAFDVDLRPQDLVDVQSLINRINSEFATAVGQPPINTSAPALVAGDFTAAIAASGNGITFTQTVGTGTAIQVEAQNNSTAAADLGLKNGSYSTGSATLTAQDRATVRANNLFTALIGLRDALRADDVNGISLAGEELSAMVDRLAGTQALVGVYANRVQQATDRQTDLSTLDEKMRSELQDLDYSQAAVRFSTLRTQLEAAYQVGATAQSLSLMDFLR